MDQNFLTHAQAARVLRDYPDVANRCVVLSFLRHCQSDPEAHSVVSQLRRNCPQLFTPQQRKIN